MYLPLETKQIFVETPEIHTDHSLQNPLKKKKKSWIQTLLTKLFKTQLIAAGSPSSKLPSYWTTIIKQNNRTNQPIMFMNRKGQKTPIFLPCSEWLITLLVDWEEMIKHFI